MSHEPVRTFQRRNELKCCFYKMSWYFYSLIGLTTLSFTLTGAYIGMTVILYYNLEYPRQSLRLLHSKIHATTQRMMVQSPTKLCCGTTWKLIDWKQDKLKITGKFSKVLSDYRVRDYARCSTHTRSFYPFRKL